MGGGVCYIFNRAHIQTRLVPLGMFSFLFCNLQEKKAINSYFLHQPYSSEPVTLWGKQKKEEVIFKRADIFQQKHTQRVKKK